MIFFLDGNSIPDAAIIHVSPPSFQFFLTCGRLIVTSGPMAVRVRGAEGSPPQA